MWNKVHFAQNWYLGLTMQDCNGIIDIFPIGLFGDEKVGGIFTVELEIGFKVTINMRFVSLDKTDSDRNLANTREKI